MWWKKLISSPVTFIYDFYELDHVHISRVSDHLITYIYTDKMKVKTKFCSPIFLLKPLIWTFKFNPFYCRNLLFVQEHANGLLLIINALFMDILNVFSHFTDFQAVKPYWFFSATIKLCLLSWPLRFASRNFWEKNIHRMFCYKCYWFSTSGSFPSHHASDLKIVCTSENTPSSY